MIEAARRAAPWAAALYLAALVIQFPFWRLFGFPVTVPDLLAVPLIGLAGLAAWSDRPRTAALLRQPIVVAIAAYGGVLLLSGAVGDDPAASLRKVITQAYLLVVPVLIALALPDVPSLKRGVRGWLAGTWLLGLLAVIGLAAWALAPGGALHRLLDNGFGSLPPGPYPRLQLSFSNPNMMVHYLGLTAPLLASAWALGWMSRGRATLLAALVAVAALSAMSPQLAGLLAAVGAWLWLERRHAWPMTARLALVGGIAAVLAMQVAVSLSPTGQAGAAALLALPGGVALYPSVRTYTWLGASDAWRAAPLLGHGIGLGPAAVWVVTPDGARHFLSDAHSQYWSLLAQAGVVGLAAFGWLLWQVSRPLRADGSSLFARSLALALVIGAAVQGLNSSFEDSRAWWAMLGLLLATIAVPIRPEPAVR